MKTKVLSLLTLPLLFGMCGCKDVESGTYFLCISTKTSTSISKSYEKFNGHATYNREFNNETTISIVTTTKSGKLVLKVTNTNTDTEYYAGNLTQDFSFTVNVPEGKYSLYVEAEEHSGSYEFSWADKK